MSFKELGRDELYRSALEDFAVDVDKDATKKEILAALAECNITWEDYLAQHPEAATEDDLKATLSSGGTVTTNTLGLDKPGLTVETTYTTTELKNSNPEPVVEDKPEVIVKENLQVSEKPYLIKMERENLLFETRGHRFTQANPYALMTAEDANWVLTNEDGFRQATPAELEEFYS